VAVEDMLALDQWAIDRAYHVQKDILTAYDDYQFHTIYQKVHNFCANEMGSLYLDITKDRQYTMQENSLGRRSTQTAMYHILEALTRWIAPILSFTADELWAYLPGERNASVMLNTWYDTLVPLSENAAFDVEFWLHVFKARDVVSKAIEQKRNEGEVKGGLTTEVIIHAGGQWHIPLQQLGDELKFVLITSKVKLIHDTTSDTALQVEVMASSHARCDRCWHQTEEVGQNETHPELCERCIDNIAGEGEQRHYA
jgi:isoleucyl-tRNA synthetase